MKEVTKTDILLLTRNYFTFSNLYKIHNKHQVCFNFRRGRQQKEDKGPRQPKRRCVGSHFLCYFIINDFLAYSNSSPFLPS